MAMTRAGKKGLRLAIASGKGGTGKTTVSASLASLWASSFRPATETRAARVTERSFPM